MNETDITCCLSYEIHFNCYWFCVILTGHVSQLCDNVGLSGVL